MAVAAPLLGGLQASTCPELGLHSLHRHIAAISAHDSHGVFSHSLASCGVPTSAPKSQYPVTYQANKLCVQDELGALARIIPVLFRRVRLGSDVVTGQPLLEVAAGNGRGVWLVLVHGSVEAASGVIQLISTAGAVLSGLLDTYRLGPEPIGKGTYATVYTLELKGGAASKVQLIAKVPEPKCCIQQEEDPVPEEVGKEVVLLSAVQGHPNVVRFHGLFHGEMPGARSDWALTMEYCSGGDLFSAVFEKVYSEDRARSTMRGLLRALAHVHARGVVHRDVKPENVLLAKGGRPVLADFGLACLVTDVREMARRRGTPGFMAPEIIDGSSYCETVDCFSSGAVLYTLVSQRMAFQGSTMESTLKLTQRCSIDFSNCTAFKSVSSMCKTMILALLQRDGRIRIDATKALEHPWLNQELDQYPEDSEELKSPEAVDKLSLDLPEPPELPELPERAWKKPWRAWRLWHLRPLKSLNLLKRRRRTVQARVEPEFAAAVPPVP